MEEEKEKVNQDISSKALASIHRSTETSDGKAAALLTALGVVFGLSVFSIDGLRAKEGAEFVFVCIFGIIYLLSFLSSMVLLVLAVFPRKKPRSIQKKMLFSYYDEDVYYAYKNGKLEGLMSKEPDMPEIMNQVEICAKISHRKQFLLRISAVSLLFFAFSLVALVILAFL